jgi:transposase-like protein
MRKRRKFTPEKKAEVALLVLSGTKTTAQVCREQHLKPELVTRWKQQLLQDASLVFGRESQRSEERDKIAELERLVGRLTMQLEIAKKTSRLLHLDENGSAS